jgi:nucleoside 2-deoxyribosyltransferase
MKKTICICGSFKFYKEMEEAASFLKQHGFKIFVPEPSHIRHGHRPEELKSNKYDEKTLKKWEGEGAFKHLSNIQKSDAVYIYNKRSYLGPAVTVEIGYSLALEKPIYANSPVSDITVTNFIRKVVTVSELCDILLK